VAGKKKAEQKTDADDLSVVPSQTKGEVAQALVRTGLSFVPLAGAPLAELVGLVLQPALEHRREEWLQRLGSAVQEIRDRPGAPTIEELSQNEVFVTVVLNATVAAMRTHQEGKLDALRAAVMNAALPMAPDEHTQLMFIRFVDELTALHLRILSYLRDPPGWFALYDIPRPNISMGARSAILESALPELKDRSDVYTQAVNELSARGLLSGSLSGMVSEQGLYQPLTSPLGNRFLDFITAPVSLT
jgi:hypothetical protein